jgi:dipeptidyl aminopeptidase/acylaminoacyl peptidase
MKYLHLLLSTLIFSLCILGAEAQIKYQRPPAEISDLVLAQPTPVVSISPDGAYMILKQRNGHPGLKQLAKEELRIGGLRINPANHGQSRARPYNGIGLQVIGQQDAKRFTGLPDENLIDHVVWAPDSKHIAFTIDEGTGISLWIADILSLEATRITDAKVNAAMPGSPFLWTDGGASIAFKEVVGDGVNLDDEFILPSGPIVQESSGEDAAIRTYQDLLKNPRDEKIFENFAISRLKSFDLKTQGVKNIANGMIMSMSVSPDGEYFLITELVKPFSYLVPYYRFPREYWIYNREGLVVTTFARIPLAEQIPKGFDAVREGPRNVQWRADESATIYWVEAQDGGNPKTEVDFRDNVYSLSAPFTGEPTLEAHCALRFGGITFGDDHNAILYERMWSTRQIVTSHFVPGNAASKRLLFDRSSEDRYSNPGSFVTTTTDAGKDVLVIDNNHVYLRGTGASPEGNRPFVRKMSLESLQQKELWRSEAPYYESAVSFAKLGDGKIITRRESKDQQPNYYILDLTSGKRDQLTNFGHPYPGLIGVSKQEVRFKRADGIDMNGDLYLPKDYNADQDGALPTIMWAYPREYKSAAAAGQVSGSPYSFIRLYYGSPIFWVTRGYAVFANASMPVVGEGDDKPNDSFREQLVMNAEAAINALVDMGVCDRDRVAIGGHSYGAFMTANLLAHSDLFAAGIARSGAYNRTLTPFGFQREERTYWDAPELYYAMSPFMHADKVNEPLLMIHGEADNNSGTFPMQSKRFYSAIKGLGGTVRLVVLPYESHGYRAEESILHMLWEQDQWLEKYVKNKNSDSPGKSD